ncbi:hypothetical protein Q9L58_009770 [Maublancomyces gigas]|uniref:Uncharacterized protein n=1 Tax=Discina gigas TaxID=1032678 RepID=A0ABR3G6M5_9PEZI
MSHANASQGLAQVSNTTAQQVSQGSQNQPQGQSSRSLTKSALNDLSGPKKQMLERYLNEGLEEDPAVVFARTQAQR